MNYLKSFLDSTEAYLILYNIYFPLNRVSLCSPSYSEIHLVDEAGFKLRNTPDYPLRVWGLKACATTPGHILLQMFMIWRNHTF